MRQDRPGSSPLLLNVALSHKHTPYVLIEAFEECLDDIACTSHGFNHNLIRIILRDASMLRPILQKWKEHRHILFVTQHKSCNDESAHGIHRYEPNQSTFIFPNCFRSTSIEPDRNSSFIVVTACGSSLENLVMQAASFVLLVVSQNSLSRGSSTTVNFRSDQACQSVPRLQRSQILLSISHRNLPQGRFSSTLQGNYSLIPLL